MQLYAVAMYPVTLLLICYLGTDVLYCPPLGLALGHTNVVAGGGAPWHSLAISHLRLAGMEHHGWRYARYIWFRQYHSPER